jgi:hypothetical protein
LLQGDQTEPMFFAYLLECGLFFRRGPFRDFGSRRMSKAHGQRTPGMLSAAGLQQQGGLNEALPQHEVDLEGRT